MVNDDIREYTRARAGSLDSAGHNSGTGSSSPMHQDHFPHRLHKMLCITSQDSRLQEIVSWSPCGGYFRVHDKQRFASEILPAFFPYQKQFKSFMRQVSLYRIQRMHQPDRLKGYYHHRLLHRDFPERSLSLKRPSTTRPSTRQDQRGKRPRDGKSRSPLLDGDGGSVAAASSQTSPTVPTTPAPILSEMRIDAGGSLGYHQMTSSTPLLMEHSRFPTTSREESKHQEGLMPPPSLLFDSQGSSSSFFQGSSVQSLVSPQGIYAAVASQVRAQPQGWQVPSQQLPQEEQSAEIIYDIVDEIIKTFGSGLNSMR